MVSLVPSVLASLVLASLALSLGSVLPALASLALWALGSLASPALLALASLARVLLALGLAQVVLFPVQLDQRGRIVRIGRILTR